MDEGWSHTSFSDSTKAPFHTEGSGSALTRNISAEQPRRCDPASRHRSVSHLLASINRLSRRVQAHFRNGAAGIRGCASLASVLQPGGEEGGMSQRPRAGTQNLPQLTDSEGLKEAKTAALF